MATLTTAFTSVFLFLTIRLLFLVFFCRVYQKQRRLERALSQCAKSLPLLEDLGKPEVTCSVYRDMAGIEQDRGHLERAVEYLTKVQ